MPEHQQIHNSKKPDTIFQKQNLSPKQIPLSNPMVVIQNAKINPKSLTHADVMQLQRTIGNQAVCKLLSSIRNPPTVQQVPIQRQEVTEEEEPIQGKMIGIIQRQKIPDEEKPLQTKSKNNTGMPDELKAGVESLSGIDMSDVRVHYNSDKPAEVGAMAYTQGINIHVAPGQERHLPHEAWHVVQQAQGKVRPTMQLMGGVSVNDDKEMEHEADVMEKRLLNDEQRNTSVGTRHFPIIKSLKPTSKIIQGLFINNKVPLSEKQLDDIRNKLIEFRAGDFLLGIKLIEEFDKKRILGQNYEIMEWINSYSSYWNNSYSQNSKKIVTDIEVLATLPPKPTKEAPRPSLTDIVSNIKEKLDKRGYRAQANYMVYDSKKYGSTEKHVDWKAHIGAYVFEMEEVAETIGNFLISSDLSHKFDVNPIQYSNKFITIYPPKEESNWKFVVNKVESLMEKYTDIEIEGDMRVGKKGRVRMRHGQNTPLTMGMLDTAGVKLERQGKLGKYDRYTGPDVVADNLPLLYYANKFFFGKDPSKEPKTLTPNEIFMAILYNGKVIPDRRDQPNPANAPLPLGVNIYTP